MTSWYDAKKYRSLESPTTGKTMADYIKDSLTRMGLSQHAMAKQYGFNASCVAAWARGVSNPGMMVLQRWEEVTGVPLDDYVPEVYEGLRYMADAPNWRRGFRFCVRQYPGCHVSRRKENQCLDGAMTIGDIMPATAAAFASAKKMYDTYYAADEDDEEELTPKQRAPKAALRERLPKESTPEAMLAVKMCRWATGQNSTRAYQLQRIGEGLWACEMESTYRIEFNTATKVVQWFWKKTGTMSFERCYHGT